MTTAVEIRNVVLGTAGHIDHGKSTLVRALTGIDPDRLQEEKDKGITIDLGFANFLYQNQFRVGIIDVPGHERFVKNMVAGATGIDIVLLVVAADDGVMPQTREHLDILTLLGVRRGIVALNKVDKVDADTLALAKDDIAELVRGTFMQKSPVVPVSALTGQGLPELWRAINDAIATTSPRDSGGLFRMPIQRVFSAKGQGAVLTGVPVRGHAKVGDTLSVLPGAQKGRVRGIQAYHRAIDEARAGHSSAFNLSGIDHTQVHRGDTMCTPGVFEPAQCFSLELRLLPNARPLKHRAEVKFHVGTSELIGHLHLLDRAALQPGEACVCEVMLEAPVIAGIGDHFIVRLPSPAVTLGGGRVIRREQERLPRNNENVLADLRAAADAIDLPAARVEQAVLAAGSAGLSRDALMARTELARETVEAELEQLLERKAVQEFGPGRALVHKEAWPRAEKALQTMLRRFHDGRPAQLGMKLVTVQQQLGVDGRTFAPVLEHALKSGTVVQHADMLALPGEGGKLTEEERKIVDVVGRQLEEALLNPPTLKELSQAAHANAEATQNAVDYLVGTGRANVLHGGVLFSTRALQMARDKVTEFLRGRAAPAAAKDFKEVLPTSRKFLIPLLEWLDEQGVTRNVDGMRTLK